MDGYKWVYMQDLFLQQLEYTEPIWSTEFKKVKTPSSDLRIYLTPAAM